MRLMPSVVEGSVKVSRRTEICSEIMLLPELQYVPLLDSLGTSADREIQRTLMELLTQLDGFDDLGKVKLIMATNRPDVLDPALLRPGRLDRKIEIALPNEQGRLEVMKIHAAKITKHGEIDYEAIVKLSDGFNGADLRNICTEAGKLCLLFQPENGTLRAC
uniref:Uncharacterized protein n=1 Tax=Rhodosorus marinus TaxID=101924 RepID=A0A7S3A6T7_9RHOD|mmetsp:Transcript_4602/g.19727  ORF Transcript_4602/g.19727 Transcript_4602/m.19727 type:complete len:162 (+) Transcript_4602:1026-1511(+)